MQSKILCPNIIRHRLLLEFRSPEISQQGSQQTLLQDFLSDLVGVLGVIRLSDIVVVDGTAHGGSSAMVIFEESGVMVHIFKPENLVTIYIDSCTKFKVKDVKDVIRQWFQPRHIRHLIIKPLE